MNPQDPRQQPVQTPPPSNAPLPPLGNVPPVQPTPQVAQQAQNQPYPGQPADTYTQPQYTSDQYSIDYLNSIAPQQQKTVNRFAIFGLIGAVLISVVVAVVIIAGSGGPSINDQLPALQLRVNTLQKVTKAQQNHLTEIQISEANAALTSALGSMDTSVQTIMKERKVKKLSEKGSKQKVSADALGKTLDDAYQRGTLDRTYTTNMVYELTLLKTQITKLRKATTNKEIREFTDSSLLSIGVVLKSYSTFNATK